MCTHLNLMFQVRFLGAQRAPLLSGRRGGAHSAAGRLHSARAGRQQVTIGKHDLPDGCFTVRRLGCAFRSMPSAQELRHGLSRRWLQNPFRGARAPEPRHSPQRGPACALSMSAANRRLAQPQAPSRARVPAYALEGTSIVGAARDDRVRGCTRTSRTWHVSRAAGCQRQRVPSDF